MHSLQKQFHEFVKSEELLTEGDKILVAVSGGLDSIVLAKLLHTSGFEFGVAHCNFNLRGDESNLDEDFVRDWTKENDVPIHVKNFQLGEGSIQLNARNERYQWFEELAASHGYSKIATAHHLDDSLETILLNLSRGTGIKGISGISSRSAKIIRPFLFASKEQLREYAISNSIEWREDSSNKTSDYNRNLIRNEVIPVMRQLNPALIGTFSNTVERLQLVSDLVSNRVNSIKEQYLFDDGGSFELSCEWISDRMDLILLSELLAEFGFNYVTSREIFASIGKSGNRFEADEFTITMDRESMFIESNNEEEPFEIVIDQPGNYAAQGTELEITIEDHPSVDNLSNNTALLDAKSLDFPIKLRKWQEGDRFIPLGMKGSKKVSDYLIDRKVPVNRKNRVLVLVSGKEIAWLVGYQISDKFKINDSTKRAFRIELMGQS